jgi:hypothetical protein
VLRLSYGRDSVQIKASSTTFFATNDVNIPAQHIPVGIWDISKQKLRLDSELTRMVAIGETENV